MCGINGFNFVDKSIIKKMNESLKHRGPNDSGIFSSKDLTLGHRRLSIIDLSKAGKQPMSYVYKKNNFKIVYNGEIYNFKELRDELILKGHSFKSNSDTEVILASYAEWGEKCVEKFNGMWAFCIYDKNKKIFFLSRDRLGKKPLYYFFDGEKFIFSSEIKGILQHKLNFKLNNEGLDLYFSLGFIPSPYSIYKNICKLGASENLVFDLTKKKIKKYKYYVYPKYSPIYHKKLLIKEFHRLLRDATKKRLVSDVPFGAFLSGGIDSSIVVYEMNKLLGEKQLQTFSIEMKESNDAKYVNHLTKNLNLKNKLSSFEEDNLERILKKIFYYFDEPFADYSLLPTFYLSEITSKEVTVAISGDGADELFGGYTHYNLISKMALLKKIPRFIRKTLLFLTPKINKTFTFREGLRVSLLHPEEIFSASWSNVYKPEITKKLTKQKMKEALDLSCGDLTEAMILFDRYFKTLGDNFLCKVDRASMANGLEVRSPFLDYRFLELSALIPSKWKANRRKTKILMKEALDGVLPKEIIYRNKEGFNSSFLEKSILKGKDLKKIVLKFSDKKIFSEEWKSFYLEKIIPSEDPQYTKYKVRLVLFDKWANQWKI